MKGQGVTGEIRS